MSYFSIPTLRIARQTSLSCEKFARNGEQKDIHVVVKNSPFVIQVEFQSSTENYNFNAVKIEPVLVYDCESQRIVDFVKHSPLEYKHHISDCGTQLTLEIRIKVLSSQLEDMLFRIKLCASDIATSQPLPKLTILSEPIRVVSKPEQVFRKPVSQRGPKKTLSEKMADMLHQLQENQAKHNQLLKQLAESRGASLKSASASVLGKRSRSDDPPPLEEAFDAFVKALTQTDASSRPSKIRKVLHDSSDEEAETLGEFLAQVANVLQRDISCVSPAICYSLNASNLFPSVEEQELTHTPRGLFEPVVSYLGIRSS